MGLFSSHRKTDASARARPSGEREELVRRGDLTAVPAGAGWHAVAARGSGESHLWPSFAVDFLIRCTDFKPLADHLRKYARYHSLEPEQVRDIHHWAEQMLQAGALITARGLTAQCAGEATGPGSPARINSIGIPTAGNEQRLRRVISSFAQNARDHGREVAFVVSSNGGDPAADAQLVHTISREASAPIELLQQAERAAMIERLSQRADVDPAIVSYALGDPFGAGFACGANRNALLLHHAGQAYLSLDDDMACELTGAPEPTPHDGRLAIFSSRDAFERWFYPAYGDAFENVSLVKADYLGLHEQLLGHSVNSRIAADGAPHFIGVSDDLLRRLRETDGRIAATFTGHFGHPGVPTSYYYLTYRDGTLARLTGGGEEKYRAYLASGGVRALVPSLAIADASLSPGMAIGIDARDLIPPFPPVMHAEDFVWGAAVWQCCPSAFAGHLPLAARHDPGLGRGILSPPLQDQAPVAMWEFAHLLRGLITAWTPPAGMSDAARRMETLGRHLGDMGSAPARDFQEHIRAFVLQHEGEKIEFMEKCLDEEEEAPAFWRDDVEAYIDQTRQALAAPDFDVPFEMRGKWDAEAARGLTQNLVREYGRLLHAWPVLMEVARAESGR